jgi:hypothetical protein
MGTEGEDFVRNAGIKDLDFLTLHSYPDSFGWSTNDVTSGCGQGPV